MSDQTTSATLSLVLDRDGLPIANGHIDVGIEYGEDGTGRKTYRHVLTTEWRAVPDA